MTARSQEATPKTRPYARGQRLYCPKCGLEIEIINPCTGPTSGQVLRCCGQDMTPQVGSSVHMESDD
jgi:uncharacterized protein (DUF983 family)